jgi:anaerobic magnesium-protoporphyrin IX monomethyl ester cyclase
MSRRVLFIFPAYGTDYEMARLPYWRGCAAPPVGLLSIVSYLSSRGHACRLLDVRELVFRRRTVKVLPLISREVDSFKPDVIGVSLLTAHFEEVRGIVAHLKKRYPAIHITVGGPHPSVEPEVTLAQIDSLDSVCVGAGEEVCLAIAQGDTFKDIAGLMLRGSEDSFQHRKAEADLDKYPFPYQDVSHLDFYTDYSAYTMPNWLCRSLIVLTARGCPYSCRFCSCEWSRPYRRHSIEYVVEMIKFTAQLGIDTLHIRDDTLAADRSRLEALCEELQRTGLFLPSGPLRWRAVMRVDQVTPELLEIMKASGCFSIGFGMESGTDRILGLINKKTTVERNAQAARYVKEAGLELSASFIVGFPTETEEEMLRTIDFMSGLDVNNRALLSFRPMPGSPYYREFVESGFLDKKRANWQTLGDISILPDRSFAAVSLKRLRELTDLGRQRSYGVQYVQVHEDIAAKCPELVQQVADSVGAQIVPLPGTGGEPRFVRASGRSSPLKSRLVDKLRGLKRRARLLLEKALRAQSS